jgi:SAM-dependent methyltransferase
MQDNVYYKKGLQKEVSDTHSWRKVENSMEFMIKYVNANHSVLDVGCGPGTITNDLARLVPNGKVCGIDTIEDLVQLGREQARQKLLENVEYRVGSATSLPFEDNAFDVVFAHQVLLHLPDPVSALVEMRRVVKPGGVICCKDADLRSILIYPENLEEPLKYFFTDLVVGPATVTDGGRRLKSHALKAGFEKSKISFSSSVWTLSKDEDREWFRKMYAARLDSAGEGRNITKDEIRKAWLDWSGDEEAVMIMVHGEMVYKK